MKMPLRTIPPLMGAKRHWALGVWDACNPIQVIVSVEVRFGCGGVDLNHRPLGYEGWPSRSLVRSVRECLLDSQRTGVDLKHFCGAASEQAIACERVIRFTSGKHVRD